MTISKKIAFAVFVLWSAKASAQVTTQTSCATPGVLTTQTTSPASSDQVAASFATQTAIDPCFFVLTSPLRQSDCTKPRDLSLQWNIGTTEQQTGGQFEIFPTASNNSCATATPPFFFYDNPVSGVPATDTLFPQGLYSASTPITTKAIMDAGGCCDPAAARDSDTGGASEALSSGATHITDTGDSSGTSSGDTSGDGATPTTAVGCDGVFYNICVVVLNNSAVPPGAANAFIQFWVDTVPPGQVVGVTASAGDRRAVINWPAVAGALKYVVTVYDPSGNAVAGTPLTTTNGITTASVSGLTNGVIYTVTVEAEDFAQNIGKPSDPLLVHPEDQCDFWECYGGKEKGGFCFVSTAAYGSYDASTTQIFRDFRDRVLLKFSAGEKLVLWYYAHGARPAVWLAQHAWARRATAIVLWPVALAAGLVVRAGPGSFALICVALLLLIVSLRRTRAAWIVLAVLLMAGPARAQGPLDDAGGVQDDVDHSDLPGESIVQRPRWGVGFKLGPYRPNIDSDPAANNVYQKYFGKSSAVAIGGGRKIQFVAEGDVYIYRGVGLLGISGSVGYWTASAKSKTCADATGAVQTCTPPLLTRNAAAGVAGYVDGGDGTDFNMVPLSISLVYKFDYLYQHYHVPLTPLVRAGFDGVFWWIDGSGRQAISRGGVKGQGLTYGFHVRPGIELSLDWLEPDSARRAFQDSGIFSSALTFEWVFNKIDDFGSRKSWDLSDNTFLAGVVLNL